MNGSESFDNVVGTSNIPQRKQKRIRKWLISLLSKGLENHEKKRDKEFFINTAQELIANNTQDVFIIDTSRKLLVQQRIMDDTKARRRLERWARNTIIIYLLIVFLLVILNGLSQIVWHEYFKTQGFISDTVMTVILSTTTINIIGLGVIVLKGHFPNYTHEDTIIPSDKTKGN